MDLQRLIREAVNESLVALFGPPPAPLQLQPTPAEFEGFYTVVCFPLAKPYEKKPDEIAQQVGAYLLTTYPQHFASYNVVKGFLNLALTDVLWTDALYAIAQHESWGRSEPTQREIVVEFSSPNTNKPLHLGHLRNNFLGDSLSALYEVLGYRVHRVQIINDRGIHICKSMAAWRRVGGGETPQGAALKGDKLVGKYYVEFDRIYKREVAERIAAGADAKQAEKEAPIMQEAVQLLRLWEAQDPDTLALWRTMNDWVYAGFEETYRRMGVRFDKLYFESQTYLLGKEEALKGLERGIFFKKEDGSVWVDLTDDGLDQKVLLRADGTSVYITQDIGTALLRYRDFPHLERQVYTVGSEQDYHFKVLFLILQKLGYPWAKFCYHLSYGMVDLPSGKMKSREGTVVDADDLMAEMVQKSKAQTLSSSKLDDAPPEAIDALAETIGIGALKYYLLKVDPAKRILFNPADSIQLHGHTAPFIQYTYARIQSVLGKAPALSVAASSCNVELLPVERRIIYWLVEYPSRLCAAAEEYNPAVVANYAYELAKEYNRLYQTTSILGEEDPDKMRLRLMLTRAAAQAIRSAMGILRINLPDRM